MPPDGQFFSPERHFLIRIGIRPEVLRALIRNSRRTRKERRTGAVPRKSHIFHFDAFAATLVGLASDTIGHVEAVPQGSERQSQAMVMVMIETAFLSALFCDPYMLTVYRASRLSMSASLEGRVRRTCHGAEIDRLKAQLGPAR